MARSETTISPLSSGAGRWTDFVWPDPLQMIGTASSNNQGRNRLLGGPITVATGGFGGGGAVLNVINTFGSLTQQIAAGGADGVGQLVRVNAGTGPAIFQSQSKQGVPSSDYQDLGASRVYGVYAYNAFGGGSAVADSGLELTISGGLIQSQSSAGVGFCRSANNVIIARCQTVGGGASSNVAVTGPGTAFPAFNDQLLNAYEIQTTSATATAEATISWVVNGVVVRRLSYGAGSVLPPFSAAVNGCFICLIPNVAQNVTMQVLTLRIIQAPTISNCY